MINHALTADAIYAAMVYLRDYAESPEGQAAMRALFDEKSAKLDAFRSMFEGFNATVYPRPVFELSDDTKEEIYPGEVESVDASIELARSMLWGPSSFASIIC